MLFDLVETMAKLTDSVAVSFSYGKDSVVTLDVCARYFKRIAVFFLYELPDMEFDERCLRYYENRYNVEIMRLPHFILSSWLRCGTYRPKENLDVPVISITDIYNYV